MELPQSELLVIECLLCFTCITSFNTDTRRQNYDQVPFRDKERELPS